MRISDLSSDVCSSDLPLRMIGPGYTGVNSIKYIKHLAFTKEQSPAKIQQTSYRWTPVGEKPSPSQDSIWELPVKSWINSPSDPGQTVPAGRVPISGLPRGGMTAAKPIKFSFKAGKDGQRAEFLGHDLGRYAGGELALTTIRVGGTHEWAAGPTTETGDPR